MEAATVSVGALFAKRVAGRVSTEVDPRLADDEAGLVAKGKARVRVIVSASFSKDDCDAGLRAFKLVAESLPVKLSKL